MIKKLTSLSRKTMLMIFIVLVAFISIFYYQGHKNSTSSNSSKLSQYFNFGGNYVFSVPKNYSVDEQSIPGVQLVYSGTLQARTIEDVFNSNGIAIQQNSVLKDNGSKAFKEYVNNTFINDLKNNLSVKDIKIKFAKSNNADVAEITVLKNGQPLRFVYLKGGQHPAQVVAKSDSDNLRVITGSIADVEQTSIKNEAKPITQAVQNYAKYIQAQDAGALYAASAQELKSHSSQDDLSKALATAKPYTSGNITIEGGSYNPNEFAAAVRFIKNDKNDQQPAIGTMVFKKVDAQWKLVSLSLPTP